MYKCRHAPLFISLTTTLNFQGSCLAIGKGEVESVDGVTSKGQRPTLRERTGREAQGEVGSEPEATGRRRAVSRAGGGVWEFSSLRGLRWGLSDLC